MANLLWTYFQVDFPHLQKQIQYQLCHKQIFQHCQVFAESLLEGIVICELVNVERPIKINRILAAFVANHKKQVFTHISLTCEQKYIAKKKYHAPQMNNSSLKNFTKSTTFLWPFSISQKLLSELTDRNSFIKEKQLKIRWINKQNWLKAQSTVFLNKKQNSFPFLKNTLFTLNKQGLYLKQ